MEYYGVIPKFHALLRFSDLIYLFRTILSSAGNDGRVRLWKATSGNVWRPAGSVGVEQTEEPNEPEHKDVEMDA
jgi:hypothetical protein